MRSSEVRRGRAQGLADEARLVRVEDLAVAVPDLHPHERRVEDVASNDRSMPRDLGVGPGRQLVGEDRLDEPLRLDEG